MRILSVGNMYPPHHYGGYELVWQAAVEYLRSRGHEVSVLTTETDTGASGVDPPYVFRRLRWHLEGGEFRRVGLRGRVGMTRHNHRTLEQHLDAVRPDVVAWWSMGGLSLTMIESVRRRGLRAVAFVHDEWLDYGRGVDPWLRTFTGRRRRRLAPIAERVFGLPAQVDFARAATYVFVSQAIRDKAAALGLRLRRTDVAHSGIHADYLSPEPPRDWGWRLVYVGRLDRRKGVDTAIEALALLPEARLELLGGWDASEELRLEELARELGVRDRVRFAGQRAREEVAAAYADADVVVFPVRWEEPWGLVPLEAMGKGRPVVATGRGGSAEYLRDGENCLLFEPGDASALARAVQRLADDPDLRTRIRQGGLETAPRHTEATLNEAVERALVDETRPERPAVAA